MTEFFGYVQQPSLRKAEGVENLWLEDISLDKVQEFIELGKKTDADLDGVQQQLHWLFLNVLRDAQGEPFEDARDLADMGRISAALARQIMDSVSEHFGGGSDEPGN